MVVVSIEHKMKQREEFVLCSDCSSVLKAVTIPCMPPSHQSTLPCISTTHTVHCALCLRTEHTTTQWLNRWHTAYQQKSGG